SRAVVTESPRRADTRVSRSQRSTISAPEGFRSRRNRGAPRDTHRRSYHPPPIRSTDPHAPSAHPLEMRLSSRLLARGDAGTGAEDGRTDADDRGPLLDRDLEILAHPHRELPKLDVLALARGELVAQAA